jgi:hypothetical protein
MREFCTGGINLVRGQPKWALGIAACLACLLAGIGGSRALRGGHVIPTDSWVDFYSIASTDLGASLPVGAEIAVYDPQGVPCGEFTVSVAGMYGIMPCYGDDPTTSQDEGAVLGDVLHFTVNGRAARTEAVSVNGALVAPDTVVIWSPVQGLWQVNLSTVAQENTATPTPTATATLTSSVTPTVTPSQTSTATVTRTTTRTPRRLWLPLAQR